MNEKIFSILEFDKIRGQLADVALTDGSRQRALDLVPSCDMDEIRRRQLHTADAKRLQGQKGTPSFGAVRDIHSACERAERVLFFLCGSFWTVQMFCGRPDRFWNIAKVIGCLTLL